MAKKRKKDTPNPQNAPQESAEKAQDSIQESPERIQPPPTEPTPQPLQDLPQESASSRLTEQIDSNENPLPEGDQANLEDSPILQPPLPLEEDKKEEVRTENPDSHSSTREPNIEEPEAMSTEEKAPGISTEQFNSSAISKPANPSAGDAGITTATLEGVSSKPEELPDLSSPDDAIRELAALQERQRVLLARVNVTEEEAKKPGWIQRFFGHTGVVQQAREKVTGKLQRGEELYKIVSVKNPDFNFNVEVVLADGRIYVVEFRGRVAYVPREVRDKLADGFKAADKYSFGS